MGPFVAAALLLTCRGADEVGLELGVEVVIVVGTIVGVEMMMVVGGRLVVGGGKITVL